VTTPQAAAVPERDVMGSIIIRPGSDSQFFATRDSARAICARIDALPRREAVIVDWTGVEAVTGAFASEYTAWSLRTRRRVGDRGTNHEVCTALNTAARRLDEAESR
jgi:hypothetical protein